MTKRPTLDVSVLDISVGTATDNEGNTMPMLIISIEKGDIVCPMSQYDAILINHGLTSALLDIADEKEKIDAITKEIEEKGPPDGQYN